MNLKKSKKRASAPLKMTFSNFFFAILIFEAKIQILRDGGTPVDEIDSDLAYPSLAIKFLSKKDAIVQLDSLEQN